MSLGREEYIIGIFLVCLSVLSVRIILDIAYSRNMGGSWARDWENLFKVSFLNVSNKKKERKKTMVSDADLVPECICCLLKEVFRFFSPFSPRYSRAVLFFL